MEKEPELTGLDRKLQILNGISSWVQGLNDEDQMSYIMGVKDIPENLLNEKIFHELVEIGTGRQELDAALQGITITDPREIDF